MIDMGRLGYAMKVNEADEERTSKAMRSEMHISPKHAFEICREIRGKMVKDAKAYLEDVIRMKRSVPFKRHKRKVGHRSDLVGWYAGRYPVKAASEILKLVRDAESNAVYKDLEPERMRIKHIATKKGRTIRGFIPRAMGRATPKNTETVTVEIILEEV
ncbi:MAG: Ribosomal protein L22/L17, eukaryotic/archaeal [Candidatus Syntrophoarchaeum butanivorans]|uniref:Large ribosomal subunit protein uL22 n=2 Tax=Candidatus Syntropharchaeum butanivorans TaxID=1839936 RepID=A0A1F2P5C6_9EURY|nr:MAG: Ribosomal protein L22/L17, eukaryotic/archaeal [Candidatus Syntrophoarchaeum butanivorans]